MINVTFVVYNNSDEFITLIESILKKYDYFKTRFNFNYSDKFDKKLLSPSNLEALTASEKKDNPAIAFMDIDHIFVLNPFWKKSIKEMIIIHELGHLVYKLQYCDDGFLEGSSKEFLADKFLSEVDSKLINDKFNDWYVSNEKDLREIFEKPISHIFRLCRIYYIVKYHMHLGCVDERVDKLISEIEEILRENNIPNEIFYELNKLIDKTFDDCTKKNIQILDEFYDKKIEKFLW